MIHLGVFFGSRSVEHEVSVITALQAIAQLQDNPKYKIVPIYISKSGECYTGDALLSIDNFKDLNAVMAKSQKVHLTRQDGRGCLIQSPVKRFSNNVIDFIDIGFPIIHGSYGEDGTLQGMLEQLNLPYVGCSVLSAAVTMDKIVAKMVMAASGVPVIPYLWFNAEEWYLRERELISEVETTFGFPVIVKPADTGSSVGVSVAKDVASFKEAVALVRQFSERILVEEYVKNLKEINISVLGDCEAHELSVCEEPITDSEFLSYADKYAGGGSKDNKTGNGAGGGMSGARREIPANIPKSWVESIEKSASAAFKALDCSGVSRIDFIINQDTEAIYVNEFNTIPGSLSFYLWEASGKPFATLLEELIQLSLRRKRRRDKLKFSNDFNILANASLSGIKK